MEREGNPNSRILPIYEWTASHLVDTLRMHAPIERVLDLGCGTAAATRMLMQASASAGITEVTGIDQSAEMLRVAKYKFHQADSTFEQEIEAVFGGKIPPELRNYWSAVRQETTSVGDRVRFIAGDLRKIDDLIGKSDTPYQAAVANHSLHWLGEDLPAFLTSLKAHLAPQGVLAWNTASDFVADNIFPPETFSFRYNELMGMVSEKLKQRGYNVDDYKEFRKPKWSVKDIEEMAQDSGWDLVQKRSILVRNDFQRFLSLDIPLILSGLLQGERLEIKEFERLGREVTAELIKERADFGLDTTHKYDVNPIFVMRNK